MHEFSMVNQIFRKCLQVAKANNATRISEINLEVGDFALIVEIYAQQAFDTLKKGSIAENAKLNFKRTPGVILCNSCKQNSEIWFSKEKEKAANEGRLEEYEKYEKAVVEKSILEADPNLGTNLFHCRKCNSSNTTLIAGKGVVIKDLRT